MECLNRHYTFSKNKVLEYSRYSLKNTYLVPSLVSKECKSNTSDRSTLEEKKIHLIHFKLKKKMYINKLIQNDSKQQMFTNLLQKILFSKCSLN